MNAVIIDIADAVVSEINGHAWSKEFVAAREFRPSYTLDQLATLRVGVVPREEDDELESRSQSRVDFTVDVFVFAKAKTDQEVADLIALVEEIKRHFAKVRSLCAYRRARYTRARVRPIYDQRLLEEKKTFASVISLTYATLE